MRPLAARTQRYSQTPYTIQLHSRLERFFSLTPPLCRMSRLPIQIGSEERHDGPLGNAPSFGITADA